MLGDPPARRPGRSRELVRRNLNAGAAAADVLEGHSRERAPAIPPSNRRSAARLLLAVAVLIVLAGLATSPSPARAQDAPVPYAGDFPDPGIMRVGDTYWAYGTGTAGVHVPVLRSTDLRSWYSPDQGSGTPAGPQLVDALPAPAAWGVPWGAPDRKEVWAPAALQLRDRFLLFYALRVQAEPRRFCVAVATSAAPAGPFVDGSAGPLICDRDPAGSIDPSAYVDARSGRAWLLWKSEGDTGGRPTRIWSRLLTRDGTAYERGSRPRELLRTSRRWEGPLIEGPSMIRYRGALYLFYSGNVWRSHRYATGVARCASPTGPCVKARGPLLTSRGAQLGPGGPDAFIGPGGRLYLAYHYWNAPFTDYPDSAQCQPSGTCAAQGQRRLAVVPLSIDRAGWPRVG